MDFLFSDDYVLFHNLINQTGNENKYEIWLVQAELYEKNSFFLFIEFVELVYHINCCNFVAITNLIENNLIK